MNKKTRETGFMKRINMLKKGVLLLTGAVDSGVPGTSRTGLGRPHVQLHQMRHLVYLFLDNIYMALEAFKLVFEGFRRCFQLAVFEHDFHFRCLEARNREAGIDRVF